MTEVMELIKLLPNGAATVAVITVVILFLKQQDKWNEALEKITTKFNEQNTYNQKIHQEQINTLAAQQYDNQRAFQEQIQLLIDGHLKVSKETIAALKSLEATVSSVKNQMDRIPITYHKIEE